MEYVVHFHDAENHILMCCRFSLIWKWIIASLMSLIYIGFTDSVASDQARCMIIHLYTLGYGFGNRIISEISKMAIPS